MHRQGCQSSETTPLREPYLGPEAPPRRWPCHGSRMRCGPWSDSAPPGRRASLLQNTPAKPDDTPPPSRRDRVQGVAHVLTRALGILEHHGVEVVVVVVGRTRAHPPNQIPSSISISDTPTSSDNSTPWVGFSSRFFRRRILLCITGPPPRTWSYVRRLSSRLWVIILSQRVGLEAQIHRRLIGLHDPAKSPKTFCTAGGPPVPAQSNDALPVPAPFGRDLGCCPVPAKLWSRCRVLSCCGGPWPCHLPGHARRV